MVVSKDIDPSSRQSKGSHGRWPHSGRIARSVDGAARALSPRTFGAHSAPKGALRVPAAVGPEVGNFARCMTLKRIPIAARQTRCELPRAIAAERQPCARARTHTKRRHKAPRRREFSTQRELAPFADALCIRTRGDKRSMGDSRESALRATEKGRAGTTARIEGRARVVESWFAAGHSVDARLPRAYTVLTSAASSQHCGLSDVNKIGCWERKARAKKNKGRGVCGMWKIQRKVKKKGMKNGEKKKSGRAVVRRRVF